MGSLESKLNNYWGTHEYKLTPYTYVSSINSSEGWAKVEFNQYGVHIPKRYRKDIMELMKYPKPTLFVFPYPRVVAEAIRKFSKYQSRGVTGRVVGATFVLSLDEEIWFQLHKNRHYLSKYFWLNRYGYSDVFIPLTEINQFLCWIIEPYPYPCPLFLDMRHRLEHECVGSVFYSSNGNRLSFRVNSQQLEEFKQKFHVCDGLFGTCNYNGHVYIEIPNVCDFYLKIWKYKNLPIMNVLIPLPPDLINIIVNYTL